MTRPTHEFSYGRDFVYRAIMEQAHTLETNPYLRYCQGRIDTSHVDTLMKVHTLDGKLVLPKGADALVLFPKHSTLARFDGKNADWPDYNRAIAFSFDMLAVQGVEHWGSREGNMGPELNEGFQDLTGGNIGPEFESLTPRTAAALAELENLPGDVVIRAVQTGVLHRNQSVLETHAAFSETESGLDTASVASFLLTHPNRLVRFIDLAIVCAGSSFSPPQICRRKGIPVFVKSLGSNHIHYGWKELKEVGHPGFGAASAMTL